MSDCSMNITTYSLCAFCDKILPKKTTVRKYVSKNYFGLPWTSALERINWEVTKGTKLPISEPQNAEHVTENCQNINNEEDCRLKKLPMELNESVKFVLLEKNQKFSSFHGHIERRGLDFGSNTTEKLISHEAKFQTQIPNPTSPQKDVVNNTTTLLAVVGSFHFLWYLGQTQHHGFLAEFGFKSEILKHLFVWEGVLLHKYIFNKIARRIFCLGGGQGFLGANEILGKV